MKVARTVLREPGAGNSPWATRRNKENKMKKLFKKKMGTSQMLLKVGEELIQLGRDTNEKENYLRSVCTAWNIACLDSFYHEECISDAVMKFRLINNANDEDTRVYGENLRKLINSKNKIFPKIRIQILSAELTEENDKITIKTTTRKK